MSVCVCVNVHIPSAIRTDGIRLASRWVYQHASITWLVFFFSLFFLLPFITRLSVISQQAAKVLGCANGQTLHAVTLPYESSYEKTQQQDQAHHLPSVWKKEGKRDDLVLKFLDQTPNGARLSNLAPGMSEKEHQNAKISPCEVLKTRWRIRLNYRFASPCLFYIAARR